jgi:hypothetical protein
MLKLAIGKNILLVIVIITILIAGGVSAGVSVLSSGPAGPKGDKGETGSVGATGTTGQAGPKGDKGATGQAGATGATGPAGPRGDTGATGSAGATGAPGPAGASGATGAIGPQGIQGLQGVQGEQGLKGETGATGATGAIGAQGLQGLQGVQGEQGLKGETGANGTQGPPGVGIVNYNATYALGSLSVGSDFTTISNVSLLAPATGTAFVTLTGNAHISDDDTSLLIIMYSNGAVINVNNVGSIGGTTSIIHSYPLTCQAVIPIIEGNYYNFIAIGSKSVGSQAVPHTATFQYFTMSVVYYPT